MEAWENLKMQFEKKCQQNLPFGKLSLRVLTHSKPPSSSFGFTLVELLASVAVIAVGMVFILGAFSQCMSSLATAEKMRKASFIIARQAWESDQEILVQNGTSEGSWEGVFEEPEGNFSWHREVRAVAADYGNESLFVQENLAEEVFDVSWKQGRSVKDLSVARYVKRKNEESE